MANARRHGIHPLETLLLPLVAALAIAVPSTGCFGRSDQGAGGLGGECIKDLDELTALLVTPQTCSTTPECPVGSYCDGASGTCEWQCYADSDCGSGNECTCEGQCEVAGQDAGVPVDPSCPREETLLLDIEANPQSCAFNDECPHGSRCDSASGRCTWDCLGTDHPTEGCTGGDVCDCFGACVEPGSTPDRIARELPKLEVLPFDIPVASETFEPRRVAVHLVAEDSDVATEAETASVVATAADGVEISCDATGQTGGTYGDSCTLDTWTFVSEADVLRARAELWVRPAAGIDPQDARWLVRLSSDKVANALRTAEVRLLEEQEPPPVFTEDGEYQGVLTTERLSSDPPGFSIFGPGLDDPAPHKVPVRAWVTSDMIDFYDQTRSITESGWLRIKNGEDIYQLLLKAPTTGGVVDIEANVRKATTDAMRSFDSSTGVVEGTFALARAAVDEWSFTLAPVGSLSTCVTAVECASGETCDLSLGGGVCVPSPGWQETLSNESLVYPKFDRWTDAVEDRIDRVWRDPDGGSDALGFPALWDIYHPRTGVSRLPEDSARALIGGLVLDDVSNPGEHPADFGLQLAAQFVEFVDSWPPRPWPVESYSLFESGSSPPLDLPEIFYNETNTGSPIPETAMRDKVPCYLETPAPQNHSDYQRPSHGLAHCEAMYENHVWLHEPGEPPAGTPTSLSQYLASECIETNDYVLHNVKDGFSPDIYTNWHRIYLCPVLPPLLGTAGSLGDERRMAERLMCYEPSPSDAGSLLQSSALGAEILPISGDLQCANGVLPSGVDLAIHADSGGSGEPTLGSGDLLSACIDDLALEPPSLGALDASNGRSQLETLFAANTCFRPANFYTAVDVVRNGVFFDSEPRERAATRLLARLLQQWTDLHSFLAREGVSVERMAKRLRPRVDLGLAEEDAIANAPGYEVLLEQQERAWALLHDNSGVLGLGHPDALVDPDYREGAPASSDHDQSVGLLVAVAEGAARHMELTAAYLEDTLDQSYGRCHLDGVDSQIAGAVERASRALRFAQFTLRTYHDVYVLVTASATPDWQPRWDSAWLEFASARQRVMDLLRRLQRCEPPPLLASEDAYPLYFGDAAGTSSRYFASSDYLLNGWAIPAVQTAASRLSEARSAFINKRNSEVQTELAADDAARRLDDIKASYGRPIINYCGLAEVEAKDALDVVGIETGALTLGNCHFDVANPSCSVDGTATPASQVYELMTDAEIQFELCVVHRVAANPGALASSDPEGQGSTYLRFVELLDHLAPAYDESSYPSASSNGDGTFTAGGSSDWSTYTLYQLASVMHLLSAIAGDEAADTLPAAKASCTEPPMGVPGFQGATPAMTATLELAPDLDRQPTAECFRGTAGEAALAVTTASNVVATAEAEMTTLHKQYEIAMKSCLDMSETYGPIAELEAAHLEHMEQLRAALTRVRSILETRSRWKSLFTVSDPFTAGMAIGGLISDAIGTGDGALRKDAFRLEEQMANEAARHAAVIQQMRDELAVRRCFAQADSIRAGFRAAAARIITALGQQDQAMASFENLRRSAAQTILEGKAAIAREEGRLIPSFAHHYWLSEHIDRFEKDFAWAKKLTFLALRAVEYEFQQSLALRSEILAATDPDQLLDAVNLLQQEQITRTINSRRPQESKLVLSLRDQIMRTADKVEIEPGERDWSAQRVFQERLWSSEYAVFDDTGQYLGQGIPFPVEPIGPLEYRCGERLWRMTATLQGDFTDLDEPAASIFVIRPNSFGSQWCDGHGDDSPLQVGSLQPTSRLFKDDQRGGFEAYTPGHITSMLQPWFNVPRSELYKEQYAEGSSEEFAGRGLYGTYTLLFPWRGLLEHGFALERLEDVLIRFDYLSVDNLTNL